MDADVDGQGEREQRVWPPRLYLAVDCGGTKAAAAICDEKSRLIGKGRGGPSNFTDEGLQPFLISVEEAVKDALDSVRRHFQESHVEWKWGNTGAASPVAVKQRPPPLDGAEGEMEEGGRDARSRGSIEELLSALRPSQICGQAGKISIQAAWFGIAGVDSPGDVTTLSPHLASLLGLPFPSTRLIVANDTSLLASPITDSSRPDIRSGVVVIAGTGSIVMSFKRSSKNGMLKVLGRVGGFGWLLGDEGSGYMVGRAAVRKILDLADLERLTMQANDEDGSDSEQEENSGSGQSPSFAIELSEGEAGGCGVLPPEGAKNDVIKSRAKRPNQQRPVREAACKAVPYGRRLRERIMQDWGLVSTDELLRAVYFDDAPQSSSSTTFERVPSITRSDVDAVQRSHECREEVPIPRDQPSSNLLPPTGPKIDEETRLRGPSPIPSLSSSPSDVGSPARGRGLQSQGDSAVTSVASSFSNQDSSQPRATSERKHRLASLTPLVFHLAFTHNDELCLDILRSQAHFIALQVQDILRPSRSARAHLSSHDSVLCLGGGLVGQQRYRNLLVEELLKLDIVFAAVEYVGDPATRGAMALSTVVEERMARA